MGARLVRVIALTERGSRFQRIRAFVARRFDPRSHLGFGLTLRLVGCLLAVWAFSSLVDAILDRDTLVRLDLAVETWFHVHSTPAGLSIFAVITQLGSPVVYVLIAVVGAYLLYRREYPLFVLSPKSTDKKPNTKSALAGWRTGVTATQDRASRLRR